MRAVLDSILLSLVSITTAPSPAPQVFFISRRACNHRNFSLKFEPPPFIQFYEGRLLEIFKPFAEFWDGNSSEASVDLYNFQIFPPCAHGSGGRQYFAEFLSKAKNIFVDIRFQELACLNFLFGLFFFEKIKIRRTKKKLYSEFEIKKKYQTQNYTEIFACTRQHIH